MPNRRFHGTVKSNRRHNANIQQAAHEAQVKQLKETLQQAMPETTVVMTKHDEIVVVFPEEK
jgi:hypothetical protein